MSEVSNETQASKTFNAEAFAMNIAKAMETSGQALAAYLKAADAKAANSPDKFESPIWVPPISFMGILGFTHTQAPLAPPTDPYSPNDNVVLSPISIFWGGAITDNIGAFAQVTRNAPPPGGFTDAFGHIWSWDNVDIRYANTATVNGISTPVTGRLTGNAIELSAEDAQYYIRDGWTKLAEWTTEDAV